MWGSEDARTGVTQESGGDQGWLGLQGKGLGPNAEPVGTNGEDRKPSVFLSNFLQTGITSIIGTK